MLDNFFKTHSLRHKIVFTTVVVEILMLSILVWNSTRVTQEILIQQADNSIQKLIPVLSSAISPPLFAQDSIAIREILERTVGQKGVVYMAVYDSQNRKIEEYGTSYTHKITPLNVGVENYLNLEKKEKVYKVHVPVTLGDYPIGFLDVEIDIEFIRQATKDVRNQGLIIALVEISLSILILALIGYALTKRLYELTEAAQKMSEGELSSRVVVDGKDELNIAANAFNQMALSIQNQTEQLNNEQERLTTLLNAMKIGVVFEDENNMIQYHNSSFRTLLSLSNEAAINGAALETVYTKMPLNILKRAQQKLKPEMGKSCELYMSNGKVLLESCNPILNKKGVGIGLLWTYEDISSEHASQKELTYWAEHDALTGLYNRHVYQAKLWQLFEDIANSNNRKILVLYFFDLDEFKVVNDTYGHEQGDEVIVNVANAVKGIIGEKDVFCRFGGDEFILLSVLNSRTEAEVFANKIIDKISKLPFNFNGSTFRMTTSLGGAIFPETTLTINSLLSHADIAMYKAKKMGKNNFQFFDKSLTSPTSAMEALNWNERLDLGFEKDLFELHFQGIYDVNTEQVEHYECLIRLRDESGQLVMPGQFIPFAERTGKILKLDRWVISQATQFLGQNTSFPSLAINISGRSFDDPNLPRFIHEKILEHNISPHRLLIELTETETVTDLSDAQAFIEALHEIGCPVCLDDFGSGFSSFGYMKQLSVEVLKIDGLFIQNLENSNENQIIVKSMVQVAQGLGKLTIAEFVETEETLLKLKELGVDMAQGFYLDKPTKFI